MNNMTFINIIIFGIFTIIMMLLLIFLVGILNYKQIIMMIRDEKIEMFENREESNSETIINALGGMIKTANKVGKKMLDPKLWSERLKLINKSPMELARMHLNENKMLD